MGCFRKFSCKYFDVNLITCNYQLVLPFVSAARKIYKSTIHMEKIEAEQDIECNDNSKTCSSLSTVKLFSMDSNSVKNPSDNQLVDPETGVKMKKASKRVSSVCETEDLPLNKKSKYETLKLQQDEIKF